MDTKLLQMTKESVNEQRPSTLYFNWISRLEYLKIFELFCFSLKHKGFLSSPNKKVVLSRSFLNFLKDFFASLRSSFFEFGKILPHPREFDHHFLPRGRELDKKFCPGGRDSLAQKNFPGGCPGGDVPSWNRLRHYHQRNCVVFGLQQHNSLIWLGFQVYK